VDSETRLKDVSEKKAGQKAAGSKSSKQQECIVCKKVCEQYIANLAIWLELVIS